MRDEQNFNYQLCTAGYDRSSIFVDCGYMGSISRHFDGLCVARKQRRTSGSHAQRFHVTKPGKSVLDIEMRFSEVYQDQLPRDEGAG